MADNGYVKAFHCIFDNLPLAGIKGTKFHLFYYIFRKTIGWNQYTQRIPLDCFERETGLSRPTIWKNLEWLEQQKWIHVIREFTSGGLPYNFYSLGEMVYKPVKEFNQLRNLTSTKPVKKFNHLPVKKLNHFSPKPVKKLNSLKERSKDIVIDNKSSTIFSEEPDPYLQLLEYKPGVLNLGKREHQDMLHEIRTFPLEQVKVVVKWAQQSNGKRGIPATGALRFIYNSLDNYDYWYEKNEKPAAKKLTAKDQAVALGLRVMQIYEALPDMPQILVQMAGLAKYYEKYSDYGVLINLPVERFREITAEKL